MSTDSEHFHYPTIITSISKVPAYNPVVKPQIHI